MIPLLKFFRFGQLTHPPAKALSARFAAFAQELSNTLPHDSAETTVAMRKLLEAKDCAVRAMLPPPATVDIAAELEAYNAEPPAPKSHPHTPANCPQHTYHLEGNTYSRCVHCGKGIGEKLDVSTQEKR